MARLRKRGWTRCQTSWGSKQRVTPRRWTAVHWRLAGATGGGLRGMAEAGANEGCHTVGVGAVSARRMRRQTYAVPQSALGPGVDDAELVIPGGHASLGRRSRDRSLTPECCWQGLGDERRSPDQTALFHAE